MKITFSILMIFTVMTITQCGKSDKSASDAKKIAEKTETKIEVRYVTAKGGLRMRDKPNTSGAKLGTIPTGTKVDLLEETGKAITISGSTGKWSKVKWGEKTGWVFGGFLSDSKPNISILGSITGKTIIAHESAQGGPPFFMVIKKGNDFTAVCNDSHLLRGEEKGALIEKFNGQWKAIEKGGKVFLTLTGQRKTVYFKKKTVIHEGAFKKSVLVVQMKNGKLHFNMKNTQTYDSCFDVSTDSVNYPWRINEEGYFPVVLSSVHIPR